MKIKNKLLLLALSFALFLQVQIKIASILGDNMVLQRNSEVKLWGKSKPNDKLTVSVGWDKSTVKTVRNPNDRCVVN